MEIARTNNRAYVEELARDQRVVAWLRAAGLTAEEAARIQPRYCETPADCMCALALSKKDAVWEGTVVVDSPKAGLTSVQIDVIHRRIEPTFGTNPADGDVVATWSALALPVGTRVLASSSRAVATIDDGEVLGKYCLGVSGGNWHTYPATLTKARALELVTMTRQQCMDALAAESADWSVARCSGRDPGPSSPQSGDESPATPQVVADDGGCSVSFASSSPESVSVLLSVISVLAVRRAARRRSAGR
jgi:hypothetical protein